MTILVPDYWDDFYTLQRRVATLEYIHTNGISPSTSVDGTSIAAPTTSTVVDGSGDIWSFGGSADSFGDYVININGTQAAAVGAGVSLTWLNGVIYANNYAGYWSKWNGGGWTLVSWNATPAYGLAVFSNDNLTVDGYSTSQSWIISNASFSSGKIYSEHFVNTNGTSSAWQIGVASSPSLDSGNSNTTIFLLNGDILVNGSNVTSPFGNPSAVVGDTIGIAVDVENGFIWFRVIHDGTVGNWNNTPGAGPSAGDSIISTPGTTPLYLLWGVSDTGEEVISNFGTSSFLATIPSGFIGC